MGKYDHKRVTREQVEQSVRSATAKPSQTELMQMAIASPWYVVMLATMNLCLKDIEEHVDAVPEEHEAAYKMVHRHVDGPLAQMQAAVEAFTVAVIDMRFDAVNCQCPTCKAEHDELPGQDRAGTDPRMN